MTMIYVKEQQLHELAVVKLTSAGLNQDVARGVADVLVHADSRGVHSHGVMRVEHYCKRLNEGGLNLHSTTSIERISPSVSILDSDDGMGHIALKEATDHAIELANETGFGFVSIKNTSHCGALSYFVQQAINANMIGICMTQTDTCVAPYGGAKRFLGTNPIAFGFPVENGDAVIVDMATSATAYGKLLHARETNTKIAEGLAIDIDGKPTTDPHQAVTLLPFGQHKGFGIALAIDALTGILMGANYSNHIVRMYDEYDKMRKLASLVMVINPLKLGNPHFAQTMAQMVNELHEEPVAPGFSSIMAPGEPEMKYKRECEKRGIPIPESIYQYLTNKE